MGAGTRASTVHGELRQRYPFCALESLPYSCRRSASTWAQPASARSAYTDDGAASRTPGAQGTLTAVRGVGRGHVQAFIVAELMPGSAALVGCRHM